LTYPISDATLHSSHRNSCTQQPQAMHTAWLFCQQCKDDAEISTQGLHHVTGTRPSAGCSRQ